MHIPTRQISKNYTRPAEGLQADEFAGIAVLGIYSLHLLRNVTYLYFGVLGLSLLIFVLLLIPNINRRKLHSSVFLFSLFYIYVSLVSILNQEYLPDANTGLFRLWALFPSVIICSILSNRGARVVYQMYSAVYVLAAATFLWQYQFGAIAWFVEATERGNTSRFGSLIGSATSYGSMLGCVGLFTLFYLRGSLRLTALLCMFGGAALSLQKSSLVNVGLVLAMALWLRVLSVRQLALCFAPFGVIYLVFGNFLLEGNGSIGTILRYIVGSIAGDTSVTTDVTVADSLIDRMSDLPLEAIQFHGWEALWIGVGVFGGSGAMGYPEIPMAHNGLVELLLMGGYIVGGAALAFLVTLLLICAKEFFHPFSSKEIRVLSGVLILWILNYVPTGGILFHPIGAPIFWISLFRFWQLKSFPRKPIGPVGENLHIKSNINSK